MPAENQKGAVGAQGNGKLKKEQSAIEGSLKSEEAVPRNEGGHSGYAVEYKNRGWWTEDANRTQLVTISECW